MEKLGKHNHKLTNILKVAIFSLVMLAPIGAVLSKVAYITFNKNANESYSQQYVETYTQVSNYQNQLIENNKFQVIYYEESTMTMSYNFYVKETDAYKFLDANETRIINNLAFIYETTYARLNIGFTNGTTERINLWNERYTTIYFTLQSTSYNQNSGLLPRAKLMIITYNTQKLDNAFYYACNQLKQEPLFNWTINTGTYTAINAMFTGLGMQSNHPLAICLCYWMICTMIYIVIDIVIFCITKLTHITNDE